jgi:prevent-host-death family protein
MEDISISKFKATCLSLLERVRKTRQPIRVTRFGKPVAEMVPPSIPARPAGWLGSLEGTGRILGDIVSPATGDREWNGLAG